MKQQTSVGAPLQPLPRELGPARTSSRLTSRAPSPGSPRQLPDSNLPSDYYRIILRHRLLILTLATIGFLAGLLLQLTTQPVYSTRTSLDIQSLNGEFMNMRALDPTSGSSSETNVQTQIKLLQSESLINRVENRLTREPHPASLERSDLLSRLRRTLHLGRSEAIPFPTLLDETSANLKVKPLGATRLIEATCDSWDPAFAAQFCNTLTREFQAEDLESRGAQAGQTSEWLVQQAADIREKAEDSEKRLVAATGGNGLMLSQESNSVGEDRLRQVQAELVKAQADRMEKEAQRSVATNSSPDAVPTVVDSPAYAAARAQLADLERQIAALVPPLTEANPKIIHLRSEIAQVNATLSRTRENGNSRLDNEYAAARHREELIAADYQKQEASVSSDLEKGSRVALLRREVESEQQLYQTLLQRAKEAGFASAMQASTIRVVDAARKPRIPVSPRRTLTALAGLMLGSLFGLAIAFIKERNTVILRAPGESKRLLHLDELGVIPSSNVAGPASLLSREPARALAKSSPASSPHAALQTADWGANVSLSAEAYRNATLSILHAEAIDQPRIYIVSSPGAGEGKTTVTSNLGVALSQAKLRVLLIDGDLRRPSLHRAFSVPNDIGLRNVLRGEIEISAATLFALCQPTAFPGLSLMPSGSGTDQTELVHGPAVADIFDRLTANFDVILVDTPPMLHMADARVFARNAHGAILIIRSGTTTRDAAVLARDLLDGDGVRLVGAILNDFDPSREGKPGYYRSYYGYRQQNAPADDLAQQP